MVNTSAVHYCAHYVIVHLDHPQREPAQKCETISLKEEASEEVDEVKEGEGGGVLDNEREVLGIIGQPRT